MAKIHKTEIYTIDSNISRKDIIIGTDGDSLNSQTKNFEVGGLIDFIGSNINIATSTFIFSDGTNPSITYGTTGYFFSENNVTNPTSVQKLYINNKNAENKSVNTLFNLFFNCGYILLKLSNVSDKSNLVYFVISNFTQTSSYFSVNAAPYKTLQNGLLQNNSEYVISFEGYFVDKLSNEDINGIKTFSSKPQFYQGFKIGPSNELQIDYTNYQAFNIKENNTDVFIVGSNFIVLGDYGNGHCVKLDYSNATAQNNVSFPNKSGTIAFLDDITTGPSGSQNIQQTLDIGNTTTTTIISDAQSNINKDLYIVKFSGSERLKIKPTELSFFLPSGNYMSSYNSIGVDVYDTYTNTYAARLISNSYGGNSAGYLFIKSNSYNCTIQGSENAGAQFDLSGPDGSVNIRGGYIQFSRTVNNSNVIIKNATGSWSGTSEQLLINANGKIPVVGTTAPTSSSSPGVLGQVVVSGNDYYWHNGTQWLKMTGTTF